MSDSPINKELNQDLVPNPWAALDDKADFEVPKATFEIYRGIEATRPGENSDNNIFRASSATYCPKRRQYQRLGVKRTPLFPRRIVNFLMGDIAEIVMLHWVKEYCVGPDALYSEVDFGEEIGKIPLRSGVKLYKQPDLEWEIAGIKGTAHADGWGKRNLDGRWELIECKSSSTYSFHNFRDEGADEGYLKQAHCTLQTGLAKSRNADGVRFFYERKETGHLWDRFCPEDPAVLEQVKKDLLIAASDVSIPPPYELEDYFPMETVSQKKDPLKTKRQRSKIAKGKIAKFPCSYCPYLEKCHGEYRVEWSSNRGHMSPTFIFGGDNGRNSNS